MLNKVEKEINNWVKAFAINGSNNFNEIAEENMCLIVFIKQQQN